MTNFSVIIPTFNRQHELQLCSAAIYQSTSKPSEIIIIDDGHLAPAFMSLLHTQAHEQGIALQYHKKDHTVQRRGLSESKNIGFKLASEPICFVLDDDCYVEPTFFQHIMRVWEQHVDAKLLGVGGTIANSRKRQRLEQWYNWIFGLTSPFTWDINNVGFQVWDDHVSSMTKGYYSHGGVSSYRTKEAHALGFNGFSGGRTALEDVDFCWRAKRQGYYFLIVPEAKLVHAATHTARESNLLMGAKESRNRNAMFRAYGQHGFIVRCKYVWAQVGWILRQFLVGNWSKAAGMVWGIFS